MQWISIIYYKLNMQVKFWENVLRVNLIMNNGNSRLIFREPEWSMKKLA